MLTAVKNQIKVSFLSTRYALEREMLNKVTFITNIIFMILNNACFIVQWIILYSIKDNIGGLEFKELLLLWGLAAGTFGFARFFCESAFNISDAINKGTLDNYLVQPKNVLLSYITSTVQVSCLGDMLYAYIMLFIYGITLKSFILFTFFCINGALIVVALAIIFGSLSFWFGRVELIADTMNSLMVNFATYPDGIFKGIVKVLFYTIIPLEFVNYIPIRLIGDFNLNSFILVICVTIFIISMSFIIFYRGLRRYSSSNLMNARV